MNTLGKPSFFDIDKYCDCIEGMILSDEVERAFWMIDNVPAWFRDNPPERLKEIRQSLHSAMFTPVEYAAADRDIDCPGTAWPARAEILSNFVRENPGSHIMELGPGSGFLARGLSERGLEFTYESRSLNSTKIEPPSGKGPVVFVCFELIEHLQNELELYQAYLKFERRAQYIFLSTPAYTYGGGMNRWREQALGHLRAYTPKEFTGVVSKMFTDFEFPNVMVCDDGTMVLRGSRV